MDLAELPVGGGSRRRTGKQEPDCGDGENDDLLDHEGLPFLNDPQLAREAPSVLTNRRRFSEILPTFWILSASTKG